MHGLLSLFDDWQSRVHSEINSTVPCFYKNKNPLTYWDWVSLYYSFMWLTIIGIGIIIGAIMGFLSATGESIGNRLFGALMGAITGGIQYGMIVAIFFFISSLFKWVYRWLLE